MSTSVRTAVPQRSRLFRDLRHRNPRSRRCKGERPPPINRSRQEPNPQWRSQQDDATDLAKVIAAHLDRDFHGDLDDLTALERCVRKGHLHTRTYRVTETLNGGDQIYLWVHHCAGTSRSMRNGHVMVVRLAVYPHPRVPGKVWCDLLIER